MDIYRLERAPSIASSMQAVAPTPTEDGVAVDASLLGAASAAGSAASLTVTQILSAFSSAVHELGANLRCSICLSLFSIRTASITMCGHSFCGPCITAWTSGKGKTFPCPLCKAALTKRGIRSDDVTRTLMASYLNLLSATGHTSHADDDDDDAGDMTQVPGQSQILAGLKSAWEASHSLAVKRSASLATLPEVPDLQVHTTAQPFHHVGETLMEVDEQLEPEVHELEPAMDELEPHMDEPEPEVRVEGDADTFQPEAVEAVAVQVEPELEPTQLEPRIPEPELEPTELQPTVQVVDDSEAAAPRAEFDLNLICDVCNVRATPGNVVQTCRSCGVAVHAACVNAARPATDWRCTPCCQRVRPVDLKCILCPVAMTVSATGVATHALPRNVVRMMAAAGRTPPANVGGFLTSPRPETFHPTLDGRFAHALCATWMPETFYVPVADLISALAAGRAAMDETAALTPLPVALHVDAVKPSPNAIMSQIPLALLFKFETVAAQRVRLGLPPHVDIPSNACATVEDETVAYAALGAGRALPFHGISHSTLTVALRWLSTWPPNAYMVCDVALRNVARDRLRCTVCGVDHVGSCVQCATGECVTPFHATCARNAGCFMILTPHHVDNSATVSDVRYAAYCPRCTPVARDAHAGRTANVDETVAEPETDETDEEFRSVRRRKKRSSRRRSRAIVEEDELELEPTSARQRGGKRSHSASVQVEEELEPSSGEKRPRMDANVEETVVVLPVDCGRSDLNSISASASKLKHCMTLVSPATGSGGGHSTLTIPATVTHVVLPVAAPTVLELADLIAANVEAPTVAHAAGATARVHHVDDLTQAEDDAETGAATLAQALDSLRRDGGSSSAHGGSSSTVVRADLNLVRRRSHAYLCALLSGVHLVSVEWVHACARSRAIVHESPYAVAGDKQCGVPGIMLAGATPLLTLTHIVDAAPSRSATSSALRAISAPSRSRDAVSTCGAGRRLWSGMDFNLVGEWECPPSNATFAQAREMITLGGGRCMPHGSDVAGFKSRGGGQLEEWAELLRRLGLDAPRRGECTLRLVIVCDDPALPVPDCVKALHETARGSVAVVNPDWLLDCASAYAILDHTAKQYMHPRAREALA